MLAFTSPNIISTSPQIFWWAELISKFFCKLNSSKYFTCPSGKLRTEFTSPIAKSTSPGLSDTTFFARWSVQITVHIFWSFPIPRKVMARTIWFSSAILKVSRFHRQNLVEDLPACRRILFTVLHAEKGRRPFSACNKGNISTSFPGSLSYTSLRRERVGENPLSHHPSLSLSRFVFRVRSSVSSSF